MQRAGRAGLEPRPQEPEGGANPYDASFWKSCLANTLVTVAVAVLFRYADFIKLLGGREIHLGWVVGIGMVGSLTMRLFLGGRIDRYGPRLVWLASLALMAAACLAHLWVTRLPNVRIDRPEVIALCAGLRILIFCAIAGVYSSSMTFISGRVPVARMAELLGMLGTSGFMGMVLGAWLGDWLLREEPATPQTIDRMFLAAGLLALGAWAAAWWATLGSDPPSPRRRPSLAGLVRRYHPGRVMVMGVAMGCVLGLPSIFLRTFGIELGISRIRLFFTVYAATAIATRIVGRRLPERLGLRRVVLIGLCTLIGSLFLFLAVAREWQLAIPAVGYGIAHAILFPAGVAEGCSTFPSRYRGLGTSLMLATYDLGQLIGAPLAGLMVHYGQRHGLPGHPTMFAGMAVLLAAATAVYATAPRAVGLAPRRRNPSAPRAAPRRAPGRVPVGRGN